jgi:glycosyltransferase involved in cell wall biosynthesis
MTAPLFTVLIDTYNYGRYVEDAVRSVLAQNFAVERVEILVVDDGSTDDTAERLKQFGTAIRYLHKPNGGQASAFNYGFAQARGEFIALLDADDAWLPGKLKRIYDALQQDARAGMVYHRVYLWRENGELSKEGHFAAVSGQVTENRVALLSYPMMQTSCLVFRRETLQELLPVPEVLRTQADAYLTALVIFVAPVLAVDEYLAKYRVHGTNLFHGAQVQVSASQLQNRMAMRSALVVEIRRWLVAHGKNLDAKNVRDYLEQWRKAQEADSYLLRAPNRWTYFRHLVEYPAIYGELMSTRHVVHDYARAGAALLLGYRHIHYFDETMAARKSRREARLRQIPPPEKSRPSGDKTSRE